MERKQSHKIWIAVLAVLLALSFVGGIGVLLHRKLVDTVPAGPTVTDSAEPSGQTPGNSETGDSETGDSQKSESAEDAAGSLTGTAKNREAVTLELYRRQPEENLPFRAENLFPGDRVTEHYRVRVAYHDRVTLHYQAEIRPGYEKLAEVLKIRVRLLSTGETLYDGRMRDMTESLTCRLASATSTVEELPFEITAYLDTQVGNEYQNRALVADFRWWVEETGNLDHSPKTGDVMALLPWAASALACGGLIFLLAARKRREGGVDA